MGRLRRPVRDVKRRLVGFRATDDERKALRDAAKRSGKGFSAWLRATALSQAAILETATRTA